MKIAVTSTGKGLDAQVDPRFGRCQYFLVIDTESMDWEAIENGNASLRGGSGIQAGQLMVQKGVKAVLTGNCGPNAFQTLAAANIEIYTGLSGPVREAVEQYKAGQLSSSSGATVDSHFGMEQGRSS